MDVRIEFTALALAQPWPLWTFGGEPADGNVCLLLEIKKVEVRCIRAHLF